MPSCFQVIRVMLLPLSHGIRALIIQTKFQFFDRELVEQIAENPYLQYFIGLPGFREEAPFDASTLVLFRKRISADMLMEVNEYLLAHKEAFWNWLDQQRPNKGTRLAKAVNFHG